MLRTSPGAPVERRHLTGALQMGRRAHPEGQSPATHAGAESAWEKMAGGLWAGKHARACRATEDVPVSLELPKDEGAAHNSNGIATD